ncbi:hypothetical protein [Oecophyllibacter saccharovorans]|uniref:hypothetical protein n=1 Tax=Oecophyllibacter saccharovorans TaxID=2558360 RepID=UPI0011705847|nr:hypothetical protein [Oecophyllibacter saccharovorans]TPW36598.1 hypothetical protein E3203_02210 [Oecophyllibacter saccharovorans]
MAEYPKSLAVPGGFAHVTLNSAEEEARFRARLSREAAPPPRKKAVKAVKAAGAAPLTAGEKNDHGNAGPADA